MGRMLDALRQVDHTRNGDGAVPEAPAEDDFVSDFANEDVPYIEVGPARSLEASPAVLAAGGTPRLRIAPQPPADAGPILQAPASPPSLGVCLRPLTGKLALLPPAQRFATDLLVFHQPEHPAVAEYQRLASLVREGAAPGQSRVVACVGVAPAAGTTTVVLNLALCFAQSHIVVVVVDGDDLRPAIAERLGLRGRPGFAEVLAGEESLDGALQETGVAGLSALTAGQPENNRLVPSAGEGWRPVLRALRDRFDLVLIDAGSGGAGLVRACDGVYMVAPHADADAPGTSERVRTLLRGGAPLRGCILTGR
jgi:Mrp family chromosome partitioning ATPase